MSKNKFSKMKGTNQRANEYKRIIVNGKSIYEYKYIWEKHNGKVPVGEGFVIHHINMNKKDNRIENLQLLKEKEHRKLHRKKNRKRIRYPSGNVKVIKIEK